MSCNDTAGPVIVLAMSTALFSAGTVRRFLEHYGDTIEVVVFVADAEDVSYFT